jgi:transposase InsO family protein
LFDSRYSSGIHYTTITLYVITKTHNLQIIAVSLNEYGQIRIKTIRTDFGHGFQTKFHWHVADLGMEHVYIKPATPRLNGKVERSHLTDKR